jgi:hypothetical protein
MSGSMFKSRLPESPKKTKFLQSHTDNNHGFKSLNRIDSEYLNTQDYIFVDDPDMEEEKFDNQRLLVGNSAKNKFWELYKSERRFKDF